MNSVRPDDWLTELAIIASSGSPLCIQSNVDLNRPESNRFYIGIRCALLLLYMFQSKAGVTLVRILGSSNILRSNRAKAKSTEILKSLVRHRLMLLSNFSNQTIILKSISNLYILLIQQDS